MIEPGDIQMLNNHVTYHGRTQYVDDAASAATGSFCAFGS